MNISKAIFTWLLTVIFGSILSALIISTHEFIFKGQFRDDILFTFILYFILISFIFSIPSIFVLKLSADYIIKQSNTKKRKITYMHIIQLLCSLVTFTCVIIGFEVHDADIFLMVIYLFLGYTSLGILLWNKLLHKEINQ